MAISPKDEFPGKIDLTDPAGYPQGKAKPISAPGALDGTPWVAKLLNDIFGFQQAILAEVAAIPTGTPDKVGASQYLDGIKSLISDATTPDATETVRGKAEIATQAETDAGADDERFITPLKLASRKIGQVAVYADRKASGTSGGSSSAGQQTRTLNTEVSDPGGLGVLSGNAITLIEGAYHVQGYAPAFQSGAHAVQLYKNGSFVAQGSSTSNQAGNDDATTISTVDAVVSSNGSDGFSLRHFITSAEGGDGLGKAVLSGQQNTYAALTFTKIG